MKRADSAKLPGVTKKASTTVERVSIDDLIPDPENARTHSARNLALIRDSLRDTGAGRSIVLDEDNVTLAGNATLASAKEIGMTHVRVVDASTPAPTVLASNSGFSDLSIERRKFTIAELKRLCGFPDDFILEGSYAQQWERLGNAVPPVMMAAIAGTIRDKILNSKKP